MRKSIAERSGDEGLHFWLPDLSSGDELYSLLILLNEINYADNARIHVNHPSLKALNDVKSGLLAARKMDTNSYNYKRFEGIAKLEDYYRESNQGFKMDSKLLNKVVFNQAGMLHAPAQKVDIILFRNSMLYYTKAYHYELKNTFDTALQAGGLICLGVKEILPEPFGDRFECLEQKEKIYGKYSFIKD